MAEENAKNMFVEVGSEVLDVESSSAAKMFLEYINTSNFNILLPNCTRIN